jgi:outer membrane lipoprotein carrier protein
VGIVGCPVERSHELAHLSPDCCDMRSAPVRIGEERGDSMKRLVMSALAAAVLATTSHTVLAQDPKKAAPANPVGAGWGGVVTPEPGASQLTEKQLAAVKKVTDYFNALTNLKANFVQTNPDAKRQRGAVLVKKPGRFRFDYNRPSLQVIVSDGKYLAIQDLDVKSDDRYELDRTPFRLLLKDQVDLLRDAQILDVQEMPEGLMISLQDKSPDAPGKITLVFSLTPEFELKEWITTDAQNLQTRVELSNIDRKEELDPKLFEIKSVALQRIQ